MSEPNTNGVDRRDDPIDADAIDPEDLAAGYIPPDPEEPPPFELWTALRDIHPWATLATLFAWALVFTALAVRGALDDPWALLPWGASATGLGVYDTAWRLLASTFLHAGIAHVSFNALSMLIFGPAVERIFTRPGFFIIFAMGGAAASWASLVWRTQRHETGLSVSVGASGAIFALGGALLAAAFRLRHRLAPGRARALGGALLFLVGQGLANGLTRNGTDNVAHAMGTAVGMLLGMVTPFHSSLAGRGPHRAVRVLGVLSALALAASLVAAVWFGLLS